MSLEHFQHHQIVMPKEKVKEKQEQFVHHKIICTKVEKYLCKLLMSLLEIKQKLFLIRLHESDWYVSYY